MAETTAQRVKRERELAGLTIHGMAKLAGIMPKTVQRIEEGKDFTGGSLQAVARALGVAAKDLLGDEEGDPGPKPEPVKRGRKKRVAVATQAAVAEEPITPEEPTT